MLKRAFDLVVAVLGLGVSAPLMAAIAVAVKLDSPGPALYRAPRVGRQGQLFTMYKFRTMVADADRRGPGLTCRRDPRVTRLGRFLRRTKLDELPQLFNVLRGDMSLVGPRPELMEYVVKYPPEYRNILEVRPGITGLAQLRFRDEESLLEEFSTASEQYLNAILPEKLKIDQYYVTHRGFLLDLQILLRSVGVVWGGGKRSHVP